MSPWYAKKFKKDLLGFWGYHYQFSIFNSYLFKKQFLKELR